MTEPTAEPQEALTDQDHMGNHKRRSHLRRWFAPEWLLLGVLVGSVGFAAMTSFVARPPVDTTAVPAAMREAAREGTLDAIATMNASGPQPEGSTSSAPAGRSFAERDANRAGDKNARVTIVEFSDFQ